MTPRPLGSACKMCRTYGARPIWILSQRLRAWLISGAPPVLAPAVDAKVAKPLTRSMFLSRDLVMFP
jgi:hypothetical protein